MYIITETFSASADKAFFSSKSSICSFPFPFPPHPLFYPSFPFGFIKCQEQHYLEMWNGWSQWVILHFQPQITLSFVCLSYWLDCAHEDPHRGPWEPSFVQWEPHSQWERAGLHQLLLLQGAGKQQSHCLWFSSLPWILVLYLPACHTQPLN